MSISKLPRQCLTAVFYNIVWPWPTYSPDSHNLLPCLHVCHTWRKALDNPSFWTHLDLTRSYIHPQVLALSQSSPLSVYFSPKSKHDIPVPPIRDFLAAESHRIITIFIQANAYPTNMVLSSLDHHNQIKIESIEINASYQHDYNAHIMDTLSTVLNICAPSLHTLSVDLGPSETARVMSDNGSATFAQLVKLHFRGPMAPGILSLLNSMPSLRELSLYCPLPECPEESNERSENSGVMITLEALHTLKICSNSFQNTTWFVNSLVFPPSTRIDIAIKHEISYPRAIQSSTLLKPFPLRCVTGDRLYIGMKSSRLSFSQPPFSLIAKSRPGFALPIGPYFSAAWHALADPERLNSLYVRPTGSGAVVSAEEWTIMLEQMPQLTGVSIDLDATGRGLLMALINPTSSGRVLLAQLQVLEVAIRSSPFEDEEEKCFDVLLHVVRKRAEIDAHIPWLKVLGESTHAKVLIVKVEAELQSLVGAAFSWKLWTPLHMFHVVDNFEIERVNQPVAFEPPA